MPWFSNTSQWSYTDVRADGNSQAPLWALSAFHDGICNICGKSFLTCSRFASISTTLASLLIPVTRFPWGI